MMKNSTFNNETCVWAVITRCFMELE